MNWYRVFYYLTVADKASVLFGWLIFFTLVGALITGFIHFIEGQELKQDEVFKNPEKDFKEKTMLYRQMGLWSRLSIILNILFWILWISIPSQKQSLLILTAGGTLTYFTQDSLGKEIPAEFRNFVLSELQEMGEKNKVEIISAKAKQETLKDLENLSTEELLNKLKENPELLELLE